MNGVNFKIYVNKGESTSSPQYVAVGGQRGGKLNRSGDTIDTTTKDDNGWKANRVGLLEWSIDGDGIYISDDEGYQLLEEAFLQKKVVLVKMAVASGIKYSGEAVITDFPLDMPYDNEVTYTVKLQGTGALTKGTDVAVLSDEPTVLSAEPKVASKTATK